MKGKPMPDKDTSAALLQRKCNSPAQFDSHRAEAPIRQPSPTRNRFNSTFAHKEEKPLIQNFTCREKQNGQPVSNAHAYG
jgi:hypothetical protein